MPGTVAGGKKAAVTNKKRYGKNFYKRIGALGGLKSTNPWLQQNKDEAVRIGSIGGSISRAGLKLIEKSDKQRKYIDIKTKKVVIYNNVKTLGKNKWVREV